MEEGRSLGSGQLTLLAIAMNSGRSEQTHLSGMHHVGIPVRDLSRSLAFYQDVFGLEAQFISEGSGPELSRAVGVPDARLTFAFIALGNTVLELLEYQAPEGRDYDRMNCDVGATHVAFEVPDIDEAYERLQKKGLTFNAPPVRIEEGPLAGCSFAYFKDPDGVQLEIFETAKRTDPV
jgi:catechol 2,3-dioxygenase-like lactoylglutathione lyase family enzyme